MAFKEYRSPRKSSSYATHEFNIKRFAYDVFAYMLRICSFPEEKIPTSSMRENIYNGVDFVKNVGLSVLPISLCMREEWRCMFEDSENLEALEISDYLDLYMPEIEGETTLIKIQISLALYNEYILFLNFKAIEKDLDTMLKLWCKFCQDFEEEIEDVGMTVESLLTINPVKPESWIGDFIRKYAIPYGSSDEVSTRFLLEIKPDETSTEGDENVVSEEHLIETSDISSEDRATYFPGSSDSELSNIPGRLHCTASSDQLQVPGKNDLVEKDALHRQRNGLSYVLLQGIKGKNTKSQKLEVEDAFEQ